MTNYGVITPPPNPTDYVAGIGSGVLYEERTNGDWTSWLPEQELQKGIIESMACVSFSFNNAIEIQANWLIQEKKLSLNQEVLLKPFIRNGRLNLSDIGLAWKSGTSQSGNSLSYVAIVGRNFAIPESVWPFKPNATSWEDLYTPPQVNFQTYTDLFFSVFDIQTEWINPDEIKKHLKQAPIQIAAPVCPGWNTQTPVAACGTGSGHATIITKASDTFSDFDHYAPFQKKLALDYKFDAALKIVLSIKQPVTMTIKENHLYQLVQGHGGFALGLGGKLIIDDTAKILASFQVRNNGDTKGKCMALTLKDWDSVPHINLKGEPV